MSEPAANPGSDADILYGMDRAQALAETGLDSAFPLPGRTAERYGERSGIYLSVYEYPSADATARLRASTTSWSCSEAQSSRSGRFPRRVRNCRWTCPPMGACAIQMIEDDKPVPRRFAGMGGVRQGWRDEHRPLVADPRRRARKRAGG